MDYVLKKRNETADLLKGLAVLCMIQVHIMEQFTNQDVYNSIIGKISLFLGGPPCAPVFLAVMGYFLLSGSKSFWYYLQRGGILLIGGILLNILRSLHLFYHIIGGKFELAPMFFIFGVDILQLAGLSIIIVGILHLIFKKNYIPYLILAILIPIISSFIPTYNSAGLTTQYLFAFVGGNYGWSYFPLIPWISYVLLGIAFRLFTFKNKSVLDFINQKYLFFLLPLVAALLITYKYGINTAHDLQGNGGYYHHDIKYFVWICAFLFVYIFIINKLENSIAKNALFNFIKWTGKNVTAIYIIQWILIGNIATLIYKTQTIYQNILWFIIITSTSSLIVFAYSKFIEYRNNEDESII